jgi:hypothetical protein
MLNEEDEIEIEDNVVNANKAMLERKILDKGYEFANPLQEWERSAGYNRPTYLHKGLTKREHFASLAMQAFINKSEFLDKEWIIKNSIEYADELIKKLNKLG